MRRYETIFILRSDLAETQVKDSIKRFEGLVAAGGGESSRLTNGDFANSPTGFTTNAEAITSGSTTRPLAP